MSLLDACFPITGAVQIGLAACRLVRNLDLVRLNLCWSSCDRDGLRQKQLFLDTLICTLNKGMERSKE